MARPLTELTHTEKVFPLFFSTLQFPRQGFLTQPAFPLPILTTAKRRKDNVHFAQSNGIHYLCKTMRKYALYIITAILTCHACTVHRPKPTKEAPESVVREWVDSAEAHIRNKNFKAALQFLNHAESAVGNVKTDSVSYHIYQDLAWIHDKSGSPRQALAYGEKALKYAQRTKKGRFIVDMLNQQVYTLYKMGCNDSAWAVTQEALKHYPRASEGQRALILQHIAYHKMLKDSLDEAQRVLAKAFRQAADTTIVPDSATLKALYSRLPMENRMLEDLLTLQNQLDTTKLETEKARQQLFFAWLLTLTATLMAALVYGARYRERRLADRYEQTIDTIRNTMEGALDSKNATIEQLKAAIDSSMQETEHLRQRLPKTYKNSRNDVFIAQTKLGVDVLHAISNGGNISQYGRREQQAATDVLKIIDARFALLLSGTTPALTPKETFYCIMEHYGKSDTEKADSFCCSEQALRSTKSRLGKKIDLNSLHQDEHPSPTISR